jgi:hypothetical protein
VFILLSTIALHTAATTPNASWRFDCPSRALGRVVKPDYYSIGLIYYYYNKNPAFDPGFVPVLIDVRYNRKGNSTTYRFYYEGMSDRQLYYILSDKRVVIDRFLNTPYTKCSNS